MWVVGPHYESEKGGAAAKKRKRHGDGDKLNIRVWDHRNVRLPMVLLVVCERG